MNRDLEQRLALCRNLPSLPAVAVQIIQLAQDPDAELSAVARSIALDPALAAKLLRIANSALYARKRRVENLAQALTLLGLNATLSLALGFSLSQTMRQGNSQRFDFQSVVRRSILAAAAARCLGEWSGLARNEDLLLAGLIQDIGILALGQVEPDGYQQILADACDNNHLVALERERLGTDHAEVGAWLVKDWHLPDFLTEALLQSESEQPQGEFNLCIALSGPIADIWIHENTQLVQLRASQLCQRFLGMDAASFAELTAEISAAIPEMASLFDLHLTDPRRTEAILDHARELVVIRNLMGLQEASRIHAEAERLHRANQAGQHEPPGDPLTALDEFAVSTLQAQFDESSDYSQPLSLAVVAIDRFEAICTDHGPEGSRRALQAVAELLLATARNGDGVTRHGDGAFCLALPATSDRQALALCSRLLPDAAGRMSPLRQAGLAVALSIGVATLDSAHHYSTPAALLDSAEHALQCARDLGGGRIERAGF